MKLNTEDYIPIAIAFGILIATASFYFVEYPGNFLGVFSSIIGIASSLVTIIGVFVVVDWRKEKGRDLNYTKCAELHFALFSLPLFIQLTTNYIYGNSAKCSLYLADKEKLKEITLETNLTIFKDIQGQLMELMSALSYYPRISSLIDKKYKKEVRYLFLLYTEFCKGVYCPIDTNGEPNEKILSIQQKLKSEDYKNCLTKLDDKKTEEIFIFE